MKAGVGHKAKAKGKKSTKKKGKKVDKKNGKKADKKTPGAKQRKPRNVGYDLSARRAVEKPKTAGERT